MPRPKTRNKAIKEVDIALVIKIGQFRNEWKKEFNQEISEIEMTRLFGEFGKLDLKLVKQVMENAKFGIRINGYQLQVKEKAHSGANQPRGAVSARESPG